MHVNDPSISFFLTLLVLKHTERINLRHMISVCTLL